jgi:hypothetical protein
MTSHLNALNLRLSNERIRFEADKSEIRAVWIKQIEKEIRDEEAFLAKSGTIEIDMTDDELLAALGA